MHIDKGIPIPSREKKTTRAGKPAIYPFARLAIGDSFAIESDKAQRLGDAAKMWKRRHTGFNYLTMKSGDQVRLWRIS